MFVCVYICVCVCVCVCMCVCLHVHVCLHTCAHICLCVLGMDGCGVCVCVYVRVPAHMHVCLHTCAHICSYLVRMCFGGGRLWCLCVLVVHVPTYMAVPVSRSEALAPVHFEFDQNLMEDYSGPLKASELELDDLTYESLRHR